jgi:hypothetical protein
LRTWCAMSRIVECRPMIFIVVVVIVVALLA